MIPDPHYGDLQCPGCFRLALQGWIDDFSFWSYLQCAECGWRSSSIEFISGEPIQFLIRRQRNAFNMECEYHELLGFEQR